MKTKADRLDSVALAVAKAVPDFNREEQEIALATYNRLAQGSPAPVADIAERVGVPEERVKALLATWPGVFLDEDKRVVGFWGLTIHRLTPTHWVKS